MKRRSIRYSDLAFFQKFHNPCIVRNSTTETNGQLSSSLKQCRIFHHSIAKNWRGIKNFPTGQRMRTPPLANLFGKTTDYMLGLEDDDKSAR